MDGDAVVAAFEQFEATRTALAALPVDTLTVEQVLAVAEMRERGRRREARIDHALTTRLIDTATPNDLGATSFKELLADRLHITGKDAGERLTDARQLGPRHTLTGERVATELAHTAAAVARGAIGTDHVRIIQKFIKKLPSWVDTAARDEFERLLANSAATMRPEHLESFAAELQAYLNQDGTEPDHDTHQRRRDFTVGPQQADGMSRLSGWLTPEARAYWDVIAAKYAAPGANLPHDDAVTATLTGRDERTAGQRHHDAFTRALRDAIESGALGRVAGVPATIVGTAKISELERAAGWAHTGAATGYRSGI